MYPLDLTLVISCLTRRNLHEIAFNVGRPVEKMVVNQDSIIQPLPDLPLANSNSVFPTRPPPPTPILDQLQSDIIKNVFIDVAQSQQIQKRTVRQLEPKWMVQRSMRLTASIFGKVAKRKRPSTEASLRTYLCQRISQGEKRCFHITEN